MIGKYPLNIVWHFFIVWLEEIFFPNKFISEKNIDTDPYAQFQKWYSQAVAKRIPFYEAMTLSTVGNNNQPTARVVLMKSFDKNGFVFYSNSNSRKGSEISQNPRASLNFFWSRTGKQVRIDGKIEIIPSSDADKYFASRPRGSQIGAWASHQSSIIPDRNCLVIKVDELKKKYKGLNVPRPDYWIGYRLVPHNFEFWQNRTDRLHDRFLFSLDDAGHWKNVRLSP